MDVVKQARPPLKQAAPLTYSICWGFAVVNTILALGMIFIYSTPVPISIANILSYKQWGIIFFLLAITTSWGLLTNSWTLTRNTQLAGVLVKAIWAIALVARSVEVPQTIIITAVWLFFAFIQISTYLHFVPTNPIMDRVGLGEERRQEGGNGRS
jgi:hypothetical protein